MLIYESNLYEKKLSRNTQRLWRINFWLIKWIFFSFILEISIKYKSVFLRHLKSYYLYYY